MQAWNEYYELLLTDEPHTAQKSEDLSRVSASVDTGLALDKSADTANFANRLMNENKNEKVIFKIDKSALIIGG